MAFNAKNLQYNKQEPAFLRRLKGEYVGQDGRQTYQAPRPKRDRLKSGDDDDDPVIVDEQGETVNKEEFERRVNGEEPAEDGTKVDLEPGKDDDDGSASLAAAKNSSERQKVSEIGGSAASKKRKVGKVVGGEEDLGGSASEASRGVRTTTEADSGAAVPIKKDTAAPKKKKGKKIKLSFDEPDG